MKRYLRLALVFAGASVSAQMEYRANFVINFISALLTAGGSLFGLLVVAGERGTIGGWSYTEAMVVVGIFTLVQGFIGGILQPNLQKLSESIRLGTMDFNLVKPIDAQFLVSLRDVNPFRLVDLVVGLLVIGWALVRLPGITLLNLLVGALLIGAALTIVYALWFGLTTTAFWFVRVQNINELFNGFFRAGVFPVSVFPGWVRLFFTLVIPVAFITTVPAEAIVGRLDGKSALTAVVVAISLFAIARWFWGFAVRSYTSASS